MRRLNQALLYNTSLDTIITLLFTVCLHKHNRAYKLISKEDQSVLFSYGLVNSNFVISPSLG